MLIGHMLIQLVNMTVNVLIERRLLQHRAPLSYNFAQDSLAYLVHAVYDHVFVSTAG